MLHPGCSIDATLSLVGDRWALLVLRDVFRGVHRFSDICADLGIARNILADRLDRLVAAGILAKVPYQERPLRHEYRLTAKGRDLSPALVAPHALGRPVGDRRRALRPSSSTTPAAPSSSSSCAARRATSR